MTRFAGLIVALMLAIQPVARADIRQVPEEYATIQAAFNAVGDDDTVLVSLGTYAEELLAPPHRFTLLGNVPLDTGNFPKPVVDPSSLDSAQSRRCMTVPQGCELTVERMKFVNRAPMFPRDPWLTGGIAVLSNQVFTVRFCSFDSVHGGIMDKLASMDIPSHPAHFVVEDCYFTHAPRLQVRVSSYSVGDISMMEVRRCRFEGYHSITGFVHGRSGSVVEECVFTGDSVSGSAHLIGSPSGGPMILRNCVFGPFNPLSERAMYVISFTGTTIEHNLFYDIQSYRTGSSFSQSLLDLSWVDGPPIYFRHNKIRNVETETEYGMAGIYAGCGGDPPSITGVRIDSNLFADTEIHPPAPGMVKDLFVGDCVAVTGNSFYDLLPLDAPVMWPFQQGRNEIRGNRFDAGDYAIVCFDPVDATRNYWGDPSGPYNASFNPGGLGARVDDEVQFDPWCIDTACALAAEPHFIPRPSTFVLSAHPNPFNGTTTLNLAPPDVMIVHVDLYDLLGRKVKSLYAGPLYEQKRITFSADNLASGIYFARVFQVIANCPLATTKLVLLK